MALVIVALEGFQNPAPVEGLQGVNANVQKAGRGFGELGGFPDAGIIHREQTGFESGSGCFGCGTRLRRVEECDFDFSRTEFRQRTFEFGGRESGELFLRTGNIAEFYPLEVEVFDESHGFGVAGGDFVSDGADAGFRQVRFRGVQRQRGEERE